MKTARSHGIVIIVVLIIACTQARPFLEDTHMLPLATYAFRGKSYVCRVSESDFFGTPQWDISKGDAPLSPRSAYVIAEKHALELVPNSKYFKPGEILLKRFIGVWYYIVQLEPSNPNAPHVSSHMEPLLIVILMNGTVVKGSVR